MITYPILSITGGMYDRVSQVVQALRGIVCALMLVTFAVLCPTKTVHAESVFDVLDKVCGGLPALCGAAEDYKNVAKACFKDKDELGCVVAIIGIGGGGGSNQLDGIFSCIKAVPNAANEADFRAKCQPYLNASGAGAYVDDAYSIYSKCAHADDVDDAIYCAQAVNNSSVVEETHTIPSWVGSLFDIYVDIDKPDYWGLVKDVGATVACGVAHFFLTVDLCGFFDDIAKVGEAIIGALGEVIDFISDLFGGGGTTYKIHGKEVSQTDFVTYLYGHAPWNPKEVVFGSVQARMEGAKSWSVHKAAVISAVRISPFKLSMTDEYANNLWTIYAQRDVYPEWDKRTRPMIALRNDAIAKSAAAIGATQVQQMLTEADETKRRKLITDTYKTCVSASQALSEALIEWTKEGRSGAGEGVTDVTSSCSYAMGQRLIPTVGPDACELKLQPTKEAFSAHCNTNRSRQLCDNVKGVVGSTALTECTGGNAVTVAQTGIMQWIKAKPFEKAGIQCGYNLLFSTVAIACEDPISVKQCNALLQKEFGASMGLPKAGVMDCQVQESRAHKDLAEKMAQVAQVLSPNFSFPGASIPATPKSKLPDCKVSSKDPLIVSCPKPTLAANAPQYKLAEQLLGVGKVRECAAGEFSGEHWVKTPCIYWYQGVVTIGNGGGQPGNTVIPLTVSATVAAGATPASFGSGRQAQVPEPSAVDEGVLTHCKAFLGRADELLCSDVTDFNACKLQVDSGKLKTCRQAGQSQVYTKSDGRPTTGNGTVRPHSPPGFGNTPLAVPGGQFPKR